RPEADSADGHGTTGDAFQPLPIPQRSRQCGQPGAGPRRRGPWLSAGNGARRDRGGSGGNGGPVGQTGSARRGTLSPWTLAKFSTDRAGPRGAANRGKRRPGKVPVAAGFFGPR